MDILSYTGKVKTFTESELYGLLAAISVSVNDLLGNIDQLKANNMDGVINGIADEWYLTKAIHRYTQDKGFRGSSFLHNLEFGLSAIKIGVMAVEKMVRHYNTKVWDGKLVTLKQANILNLVEHFYFWGEYTSKILDVLLTIQLNKVDPAKYLSGHDQKWLNGTQEFYKHFTVELLKGSKMMISTLEKVPDAEISEVSIDVLESTTGKSATDMVGKGFGIHNLNPLFWIGLGMKNINLARIDNMRAKNQQHAMKISQAINRRDGTNDPQIDRTIEIYQEKIIKNEHAIEQIIRSYD